MILSVLLEYNHSIDIIIVKFTSRFPHSLDVLDGKFCETFRCRFYRTNPMCLVRWVHPVMCCECMMMMNCLTLTRVVKKTIRLPYNTSLKSLIQCPEQLSGYVVNTHVTCVHVRPLPVGILSSYSQVLKYYKTCEYELQTPTESSAHWGRGVA